MSTHSFHPRGQIKTTWWESDTGACASIEFDGCRIDIFAIEADARERLERAISAFAAEMQREPVAQQQAAE
jgi:exonuclease III